MPFICPDNVDLQFLVSLPAVSTMRYYVYLAMIHVAGEAQKVDLIPHDIDEVSSYHSYALI